MDFTVEIDGLTSAIRHVVVQKAIQVRQHPAPSLSRCAQPRIDTLCVLDSPNGCVSFTDYAWQFFVPALSPDDTVIMNNPGIHKDHALSRVSRCLPRVGALYLESFV